MPVIYSANVVDRSILELTEKFNGWGMVLYVLITAVIAGILAAFLGFERYRMGENAGLRTHAFLSIGCSLLMAISIWAMKNAAPTSYDISRIAAGAVTGVGFLGGGVIIKDRFTVKGLSTAANLWVCSAIGLAVGAGFIIEAIVGAGVAYIFVFLRNRVIIRIDKNAPKVVVRAKSGTSIIHEIKMICDLNGLNVRTIDIAEISDKYVETNVFFPYSVNPNILDYFMMEVRKKDFVISVSKHISKNHRKADTTHES